MRAIEARGFHYANGADETIFEDTFPDWYQMTWLMRDYGERQNGLNEGSAPGASPTGRLLQVPNEVRPESDAGIHR